MRRVRYSVAMSLDGYVAGPNGESDWIVGLDPDTSSVKPGNNVVAYWGVSDAKAAHARLLGLGAGENSPVRDVGGGILVGSVLDPFGNVLGIIENPHFKLG
jgi:predicted enzyme related to lactoylglutathione lyase